jgi:hypothetical protein
MQPHDALPLGLRYSGPTVTSRPELVPGKPIVLHLGVCSLPQAEVTPMS